MVAAWPGRGRAGAARWIVGCATMLVGLLVLLTGLVPPHLMATGQVDPWAWGWPILCGAGALALMFRWAAGRQAAGRWWTVAVIPALFALVAPPLILCVSVSAGQGGRAAIWLMPPSRMIAPPSARPMLAILSGPQLHGPAPKSSVKGDGIAGFTEAPLWRALNLWFTAVPLAALDDIGLARTSLLLLVQPRALAPEELVTLDNWVQRGGRAVILTDPDLLWHDERPLGHVLRPPPTSLLDPLLRHWGLTLAAAPARSGGDPVVRRFLDDGRMLQVAGASHFIPVRGAPCILASGGLVARCSLGRGTAILVADADFANDALWTTDGAAPGRAAAWTSDAVPALLNWLEPGRADAMGRRVWMVRADGLSAALRPALGMLVLLAGFTAILFHGGGTKREL